MTFNFEAFNQVSPSQNSSPSANRGTSYTITSVDQFERQWTATAINVPGSAKNEHIHAIDCNSITEKHNIAIDCIGRSTKLAHSLRSTQLDRLISASLSDRTRRAYRDDLAAFEAWIGHSIPATPGEVAEYVAEMAQTYKPATLTRRLASISKAHRAGGLTSPVSSELVRAAMRGIRREYGTAQRQAKPLMRDDLMDLLDRLPKNRKGIRDRALLLVGFAGGFRRSELVDLNVEDIEQARQGMIITLHRSKTDQEGRGRKIGIPYSRGRHCPVKALEAWQADSGITAGAIFRPINKHGHIAVDQRLSGEAVSIIVKEAVKIIHLDPHQYSGHSLRAGLATSAAMAGVPSWKIRQQTGHTSDAMLSRYVRDGDLFTGNAAGHIL